MGKRSFLEKRSFLQLAEQQLGKLPKFFIYVVLEWMIILILFIDRFLAFLANKLAKLFGLDIPCLLCTRTDHALVSRNELFFYNDSICDSHKKTVSCLAFCHDHKKLSDMRNLCENCLLSFATERESDCQNYKSLLGILHQDIELFLDEEQRVHLSLPTGIKDEKVGEKSNGHCACCGKPLKVKSSDSKCKSSTLSSLVPTPSPHAPANRNLDLPRPVPSLLKRNSIPYESVISDSSKGTTVEKPSVEYVKPGTLPASLLDADEDKTPNVVLGNRFFGIPLLDSAANTPRTTRIPRKSLMKRSESVSEIPVGQVAKSEAEGDILQNLKGQVRMDRKSLMALCMELDEEKSASAEAANNAMAMITRLQTEKAAVQMEALQYQRMMEEQAEYDQEALLELYNLLVKREEENSNLEAELDAYRQKYGFLKLRGVDLRKQRDNTDEKDNVLKLLSYSFNGRFESGSASSFRRSPGPKTPNLDNFGGEDAAFADKKKVPRGMRQLGRLKHLDRSESSRCNTTNVTDEVDCNQKTIDNQRFLKIYNSFNDRDV